jgi:hypothetical protein
MHVAPHHEGTGSIDIRLDETEAQHLLSILLHAKFSDDVRIDVVMSPTMRGLLRGLVEARMALGFDRNESPGWTRIEEVGGLRAPPSFPEIESELRRLLKKEDVSKELAEAIYPFIWDRTASDQP